MARDYFPDNEPDMLGFSRRFLAAMAVDPHAYGLTPQQVSTAQDACDAFALSLSQARSTNRGRIDVAAKNTDKRRLERLIRPLARLAAAQTWLDDAQRADLGLTLPPHRAPRVNAPTVEPTITVEPRSRGAVIRLGSWDEAPHRGRPRGVKGAMIFYAVSDSPNNAPSEWTFIEITTKVKLRVQLPLSVPAGSIVFYNACWLSPTLQRGPMSQSPVSTRVLDGLGVIGSIRRAA